MAETRHCQGSFYDNASERVYPCGGKAHAPIKRGPSEVWLCIACHPEFRKKADKRWLVDASGPDGLKLAKATVEFFETYNIAARVELGQQVLQMARKLVESVEGT